MVVQRRQKNNVLCVHVAPGARPPSNRSDETTTGLLHLRASGIPEKTARTSRRVVLNLSKAVAAAL